MGKNVYYLLLALIVDACLVESYKEYQTKIPNGHRVPHPCLYNTIWGGVGHENPNGAGVRNPFGIDFAANGFRWDLCLCTKDSDGDGKTNGEELGDPSCIWVADSGELPSRIEDLTHPGVCEPLDDPVCKELNKFEVCEPVKFECDALSEPGVYPVDVQLTPYEIPSKQTSHACYVVEFDTTKEMHAIAMEPLINQTEIVHHIDMIECRDGEPGQEFPETLECGVMKGCSGVMLATWTLGIPGICLLPQVGIRLGKNGARGALLSIHYHNPFNREGRIDSSGLRMWVTEDLRENSAQVFNMAQGYLEIPPHQSRVEQYIECDDRCTQQWKEPVYLVFGGLHMHYLGTGGRTELWRNGVFHQVIMDQDYFDYNSPHIETFDPPIEVLPGDTIKHTCVFQSREKDVVTWRGREATDEMCESVVVYYPAQNFSRCDNNGKILRCGYIDDRPREEFWGECDTAEFDSMFKPNLLDELKLVCNTSVCLPECEVLVNQAYANYTCLGPDYYDGIFKRDDTLRNLMRSCADYPPPEPVPSVSIPEIIVCGDATTAARNMSLFMFLSLVFTVVLATP